MDSQLTLKIIRALPVAHTDTGDFFIHDEKLTREFEIRGIVLRKRAGLLFIKIDDEKFSFSSPLSLCEGDCVKCIIRAEPTIQNTTEQKGLETSNAIFIIQSISLCK